MTIKFEMFGHDTIKDVDKNAFVALVTAGGAVKEVNVRDGIGRAGAQLIVARCDGEIVGVAALKVPVPTYWPKLTEKSGFDVTPTTFPRELGYVAVSPAHEGKGIAKTLCDLTMRLAGDQGVFATTASAPMLTSILPRLGFNCVGRVWAGEPNDVTKILPALHLMVRPEITQPIAEVGMEASNSTDGES